MGQKVSFQTCCWLFVYLSGFYIYLFRMYIVTTRNMFNEPTHGVSGRPISARFKNFALFGPWRQDG